MVGTMLGGDVETLEDSLDRLWRIRPTRLQALAAGHTNKTYLVEWDAGRAVLRVSWPGKPLDQVRREATILGYLGQRAQSPALPRLRATTDAALYAQTRDGRWLHLFEHIDGRPGLPVDGVSGTIRAMHTLAQLHADMAHIPSTASNPTDWIQSRLARVAAPTMRPSHPPVELFGRQDDVLARVGNHLASASSWLHEPVSWLHGDYHAGNLLYVDGEVSGMLDFDDVGQGSQWLEAAFALFALSRDATREDFLVFDATTWDAGLRAYAQTRRETLPAWLPKKREALSLLFCADQTLIHLEAAQRGLWTLGPGIGFLGVWRTLLAQPVPDD